MPRHLAQFTTPLESVCDWARPERWEEFMMRKAVNLITSEFPLARPAPHVVIPFGLLAHLREAGWLITIKYGYPHEDGEYIHVDGKRLRGYYEPYEVLGVCISRTLAMEDKNESCLYLDLTCEEPVAKHFTRCTAHAVYFYVAVVQGKYREQGIGHELVRRAVEKHKEAIGYVPYSTLVAKHGKEAKVMFEPMYYLVKAPPGVKYFWNQVFTFMCLKERYMKKSEETEHLYKLREHAAACWQHVQRRYSPTPGRASWLPCIYQDDWHMQYIVYKEPLPP